MNNNLRVVVLGPVGQGKSHLAYVIEKALQEEYGETIQIESADLEDEKRLIGHDINNWTRPKCEKITIHETTEGALKKGRYKFGLKDGAYASRTGRLLLEMMQDHATSVSVHGSSRSVLVFTLSAPHQTLAEVAHLLKLDTGDLFPLASEFILEDIGLSGTLFNTKVEGKIENIYSISEGQDAHSDLRVMNIVVHYR